MAIPLKALLFFTLFGLASSRLVHVILIARHGLTAPNSYILSEYFENGPS